MASLFGRATTCDPATRAWHARSAAASSPHGAAESQRCGLEPSTKDEVLLDVDDVALGHETKLRWNTLDAWVWSTDPAHEALVSREDYERAQRLQAAAARRPVDRKPHRSRHDYVFKGFDLVRQMRAAHAGPLGQRPVLLPLPLPERVRPRQQGRPSPQRLPPRSRRPGPAGCLAGPGVRPPRLADTLNRLADATTDDPGQDIELEAARRALAECDQRLARYRAALEAGTDPALIARWTAEVNAQRVMAQTRLRQATGRTRMTPAEISAIVTAMGGLIEVLRHADPADKAAVYLGLEC
jgi:site-specific DNA recombinase